MDANLVAGVLNDSIRLSFDVFSCAVSRRYPHNGKFHIPRHSGIFSLPFANTECFACFLPAQWDDRTRSLLILLRRASIFGEMEAAVPAAVHSRSDRVLRLLLAV